MESSPKPFQKQPPEEFYKKGVLKNFTKFREKHLCQRLLTELQIFLRCCLIHIKHHHHETLYIYYICQRHSHGFSYGGAKSKNCGPFSAKIFFRKRRPVRLFVNGVKGRSKRKRQYLYDTKCRLNFYK